jgi:hypothetical protein
MHLSCGKYNTPSFKFLPLLSKPTFFVVVRKAAVVLSASVTFLSLPGLKAFSWTTGMVAILFAAFSIGSDGCKLSSVRHKADMERPIGIEGMMVITVRRWWFYF